MRAAVGLLAAVAVLTGCTGGLEATPRGEVIPVADREPAPEVGGELVGGGTLDPTATAGVVTVVNFWGSWCGPCRVEVPELQGIADAHPEVAVVGVDLRDQEQFAQAFLDEQGITYPSVHDPSGELAAAFAAWPATQTPSTVVIDADGLVAAAYSGPVTAADLQRALDQLD
ncbi:Peroxiredoxin [Klenkia soli]|uniref:Peroxiredoxin n=1 Tax=Klenkia soli TaxID=1052260 RepID=A0A1H0BH34_9ACTN|nr:TlpA disulfide reductase family protein [Klenkia soli]SDN44942.1 Peroxiredoxin [Klenkia soli]